jgi:sigma-E factor negative regulatory protein RseC
MEQKVRVVSCNADGTAKVILVRESACSGDCHKCSGCGAAKQTMFVTAHNPIGASVGSVVMIQSESAPVLKAAAMLYMLPLGLFFLGYILGDELWQLGGLVGGLAFVLGIAGAVLYDRLVMKKKHTVYTITGYAHKG